MCEREREKERERERDREREKEREHQRRTGLRPSVHRSFHAAHTKADAKSTNDVDTDDIVKPDLIDFRLLCVCVRACVRVACDSHVRVDRA